MKSLELLFDHRGTICINATDLLRYLFRGIMAVYLQNSWPKSAHMKWLISTLFVVILIFVFGFREKNAVKITNEKNVVTASVTGENDVEAVNIYAEKSSVKQNDEEQPLELVEYAKTLIGTPYLYGSTDPAKGLDCSGFINAVYNHFGMKVPRSSVEFTNAGISVDADNAKPGDLILFTGTDPGKRVVGHIGIVTKNNDGEMQFIHSSSGKANGVTMSELEGYYETRFVKVIRVSPDDERKTFS